ncbi:MAG TPA: hypothetical protein VKS25_15060 [Solirubrobacteraceae bacterium]|nr:hypothetical protein [Solirubrobacteraceae bacterium]
MGEGQPCHPEVPGRQRLFLVEHYVPLLDEQRALALSRGLDGAAAKLRRVGRQIRWLETLALLDDEVCLSLFAASATAEVNDVNRRARIDYDRVLVVTRVVPPT